MTSRYVTQDIIDAVQAASSDPTPPSVEMEEEAYRIYRLCDGDLQLVATATDPQSVGVALVTLANEDEFDKCPVGLMFRPDDKPGKWLIKPWLPFPTPKTVSDAGRTLRSARTP